MALSIMNYTREITYRPGELIKTYLPPIEDRATDTDANTTAIVLDGVTPDGPDTHGMVRILVPSGVRVVDSVSVGVWIEQTD